MSKNTYNAAPRKAKAVFVPSNKRAVLCLKCGSLGLVDRERIKPTTRFRCTRCGELMTLEVPADRLKVLPPAESSREADDRPPRKRLGRRYIIRNQYALLAHVWTGSGSACGLLIASQLSNPEIRRDTRGLDICAACLEGKYT